VTVFVLLGVGAVAVVFPELATALAHFVGVGRGADLITYIAIVGVMFALIHYDTKFVELQQQVTELTRELALLRSESIGGIKTQLTKPPFSAPHPRPPAAAPPRPAQRWGIFDDLGGVIWVTLDIWPRRELDVRARATGQPGDPRAEPRCTAATC
jgi:hypothetical protein